MTRRLLGAGLLLGVLLALPSGGLLAQKKKGEPKKNAPPADSDKLGVNRINGVLKSVPGTDRLFTLEIAQVTLAPAGKGKGGRPRAKAGRGGNGTGRILQLQRQIAQAQLQSRRARNIQQRVQAANRIARMQVQLQREVARLRSTAARAPAGFKYTVSKQEFEFQLREGVKVRSMSLPDQFDEKGRLKKLTKAEKDAARGKDKNLPGYEASLDRLEVGQAVQLVLSGAPKKADPKNKDLDADDAEGEKKMQVKLIVILGEAQQGPPPRKGKKK